MNRERRIQELLEANNRYLERARAAEAELAAHKGYCLQAGDSIKWLLKRVRELQNQVPAEEVRRAARSLLNDASAGVAAAHATAALTCGESTALNPDGTVYGDTTVPAKVMYTNHRGETAERTITPKYVWYGSTEWHKEPQWLLLAFDHDKQANRDFALKDFGHSEPVGQAVARDEDNMPERIWAGDFNASGFGHCVIGQQGGLYAEYVRADLAVPAAGEPVAWWVRERPGFEWQLVRSDPDRDPHFHCWEKQPLYVHPTLSKEVAFQDRVQPWMMACFGPEISGDRVERGDRLLEEVFELLQSGGYDKDRVLSLRDYVWGRDVGEPAQELGGVKVTLAAYCLAHGLDMHAAGETELARIWTKVDQIRAKQAAKPKHSPSPVASAMPTNAGEPSIKALEWGAYVHGGQTADSIFGTYSVWEIGVGYWRPPGGYAGRPADGGIGAARAAAQADYEARIRAALVPTSQTKGSE